jgi:hypothetical protein
MFSYNEYKNIINLVKFHLPIIDFAGVTKETKNYCVIRHDIEFSLDRAYKLALLESKLGISSTYTVQLRNNTYNALSDKNLTLIHKIEQLGHRIGLHICPDMFSNKKKITEEILQEINILQNYCGFEIDRFAFHYFHYFTTRPDKLNVTYLSDSNHQWKSGHPIDLDFSKTKKLQINTHPFSWTEKGFESYGNFLSLIKERNNEMLYDMSTENRAFPKELLL